MFTYSKLAQAGIAAVSYLAEISGERRLAGSGEIAEARRLSKVLVAKILTKLSTAGVVSGKSGPAGGYLLAREPDKISLFDVVVVFEDVKSQMMCPFGPHWCGVGPQCPLHNTFVSLREKVLDRLRHESFAQFQGATGLSGGRTMLEATDRETAADITGLRGVIVDAKNGVANGIAEI